MGARRGERKRSRAGVGEMLTTGAIVRITERMHRLVLALILVAGRASSQLQFEVASIKPSDGNSQMSLRRYPGGRFVTTGTSVRFLITWAYDLGDERLIGGPGWLDSARFDISAKAPSENPTSDELHGMMKQLLAERFRLRVHTDKRDLPMYTLESDRNGPKVHALDTPLAVNHDPFKMTGAGKLTGTSVTTGMLSNVLTNQLGHFVSDQTGFRGAFDFTLEWRPDSAPSGGDIQDDNRASVFTAIREQLGFRLTAGRAPVQVIVIDHVESHPTEN
jgi:uncharacterized protein (TIGR03435 family)